MKKATYEMKAFNHDIAENPINISMQGMDRGPSKHQNKSKTTNICQNTQEIHYN